MSMFKPKLKILKSQEEESYHPWERRIKNEHNRTYKYGHNSANNPGYPKEKSSKIRIKVTVIGNRVTKEYIYCYYLAKALFKYKKSRFEPPVFHGVSSVEWPTVWNNLKIRYGTPAFMLQSQVAVLIDNNFLGGENELRKFTQSKYDSYLHKDFYKEGVLQLANYIKSCGRPCAYLHISIEGREIGTLIVMLFADIVPHTCENFLRLCESTKGGYSGTPVHRIVKDCWIQCGGFDLKNNSDLACENFIASHDRRGVFCMANAERHVECSTQFFVLLQPAPWMEHKYVAFGQLIQGEETLRVIENVPTWHESPAKEIIIYKTGILNMECNYIPINRNTNEYIEAHIENLNELVDYINEVLIANLFKTIESRLRAENETTMRAQNLHATKRFIRKKSQISSNDDHNTSTPESSKSSEQEMNFDLEVNDNKIDSSTEVTTSSVFVNSIKPYYLPLTDVPYPGEITSTHDIKKLLHGNYCYEGDIDQEDDYRIKRKKQTKKKTLFKSESIKSALFYRFYKYNSSENLLNYHDKGVAIQNYIREHADGISFAGPVIQNIGKVTEKSEILEVENVKSPTTAL